VSGTVLIVDDEAEIREIIELSVSTLGLETLQAADGLQALEIVRSRRVDVVVSDLMMPRMTGTTLLSALRAEGHTQPFIFVTAFPSQDTTLQALRLGAFDYVEKPFDPDDLEVILREAVRVGCESQDKASAQSGADGRAHAAINRLKSLRLTDAAAATEAAAGSARLTELFAQETLPQLSFCEGAIKGLGNPDQRQFELGYLYRVAQAVAGAGAAIGEQAIAGVANATARFYTVLRVKPQAVSPEVVDLAQRANGLMERLATAAGLPDQAADETAELVEELTRAARDIETWRAA
jgi:DNA-binding response OmpR family regulator